MAYPNNNANFYHSTTDTTENFDVYRTLTSAAEAANTQAFDTLTSLCYDAIEANRCYGGTGWFHGQSPDQRLDTKRLR